jgi:hypothetical protein
LGDVIDVLPYFNDRKYKMYDIEPSDDRIARNNALQTGIPEQTGSVDYVFLDPPSDFFPHVGEPGFSAQAAKAETMMKLKGVIRETSRVLKKGGRVSIIAEPMAGEEFIDFPTEVSLLMKDLGLKPIGKVYLPRRSDTSRHHAEGFGVKMLASDCREMLTFEKV